MSIELLKARIKEGLLSEDNTERGRFVHHRTALNTLLKKRNVAEADLALALTLDLDNTILKLRKQLENENKSDTRSPLTRIRRLAEFYGDICHIDAGSLSLAETLQAAAKRKYRDKVWTGPVTPSTQKEIKKSHITYREIAREIVGKAITECPEAWPKAKPYPEGTRPPSGVTSATQQLRCYFTGESSPAERVPDIRFHFIEDFFHLPRNTLLNKARRKVDHNNLGLSRSEKDPSAVNRETFKHKELSENLQKLFDDYYAFKHHYKQPELVNISDKLRKSRHYANRAKVREHNRRKESWTTNSKGLAGSAKAFHGQLVKFQNYCVREEGIPYAHVSSMHLTDPILLGNMADYASRLQTGASNYYRLLNFIKRTAGNQGYLRFCADRGDRTMEEFTDDLEYIIEEYPTWAEASKKGIGERGKGGIKGKKNVQFLVKMPFQERRELVYKASLWLLSEAESSLIEAKQKVKFAKSAKTPAQVKKLKISAASYARDALKSARAALIQEIAFYSIPREGNFSELKYYPNASLQSERFSSLTWLRQRNRFRLFIPCYGSSIVTPDDGKSYRVIKNADAKNAVNIDIELPEHLTPLIKNYIEIRKQYIAMDLMEFGGLKSADDMEFLFPWRSIRKDLVTNPEIIALRERFIELPNKLGGDFKAVTRTAYQAVAPDEKQHGINMHGLRHLVAETHLDEFPGDYIGAAAKLNDDVEQIITTYGDKDRAKAMRRVAEAEQTGSSFTYE